MSTSTPKDKPRRPTPPPRHGATAAEIQAYALNKLLANPDKPVHIPAAPPSGIKQLRAPREMMKNVQGSSAGAGSGEFHVYKQSRRREYERLKIMDEEEAYAKDKADAEQRHIEYQSTADAKTAKNRLKRQRKKAGRSKGKAGDGDEEDGPTAAAAEEGGEKKRKLGGGGGMKFKTAEEREAEAEEEAAAADDAVVATSEQVAHEEAVAAAKEAGINIRDDD